MQRAIMKGSEAIKIVNHLLEEEKDRAARIALLNFEDVNLYINTVKEMQKNLKDILRSAMTNLNLGKNFKATSTLIYGGYTFHLKRGGQDQHGNRRPTTYTVTPTPPSEKLSCLLIELQQQEIKLKDRKEKQDKLEYRVFMTQLMKRAPLSAAQNNVQALDVEEKKEITMDAESIHEGAADAENQVALEALESYQGLADQYKDLTQKLEIVQAKEEEKTTLLSAVLPQNEKLQQDVRMLKSQIVRLAEENKRSTEAVAATQNKLVEQKAELARLKPQEHLNSHIKCDDLIDILKKINSKSGTSFFSTSINPIINNLMALSKLKKELISIEQIRNCIKDPEVLKIFNDPTPHRTTSLDSTSFIVRELGILFRLPPLQPTASNVKIA